MPIKRWIVLLILLAIVVFIFSRTAHAEYYLVYGGAPIVVPVYAKSLYHRRCYHSRRPPYRVVVHHRYHSCYSRCCRRACFSRLKYVVPMYYHTYIASPEPVRYQRYPIQYYPAYYDLYYDPDLATGDDDQVRHPAMEISY